MFYTSYNNVYIVIIFASLITVCNTQGIVCQNEAHNVTNSFIWGPNHTYAPRQNCLYQFTVSDDYYLTLRIQMFNSSTWDEVKVFDYHGNAVNVGSQLSKSLTQVYPSPGLVLKVKTGSASILNVQMTLTASKVNLPPVTSSISVYVSPNLPPFVKRNFSVGKAYVITAKTQVFLTTVNCPINGDFNNWSNVLLFDGSGPNATIAGSLYQTISNKPFISTGKSLTLYGLLAAPLVSYFIADDYENVKKVQTYDTAWAVSADYGFNSVHLDASNGIAALIVGNGYYDDSTYVADLKLTDPSATLTVHSGINLVNKSLINYSANSVQNYMPQKFPVSHFTTFVLNKGKAILNLTTSGAAANWTTNLSAGRKGLLISPNYGYSGNQQTILPFHLGTNSFSQQMTFEVSYFAGNPDPASYIIFNIMGVGPMQVVNTSISTLKREPVSYLASSIQLEYFPISNPSTGVILAFSVQNADSSNFGVVMFFIFTNALWNS